MNLLEIVGISVVLGVSVGVTVSVFMILFTGGAKDLWDFIKWVIGGQKT